MSKQIAQQLASGTVDRDAGGDVDARLDQKLVSAQNNVVTSRGAYDQSLRHRAEVINLAHAAGWSKYQIAKRLSLTRRAVDEALERPRERTALQFLDLLVKQNGGREDRGTRGLRERLTRNTAQPIPPEQQRALLARFEATMTEDDAHELELLIAELGDHSDETRQG